MAVISQGTLLWHQETLASLRSSPAQSCPYVAHIHFMVACIRKYSVESLYSLQVMLGARIVGMACSNRLGVKQTLKRWAQSFFLKVSGLLATLVADRSNIDLLHLCTFRIMSQLCIMQNIWMCVFVCVEYYIACLPPPNTKDFLSGPSLIFLQSVIPLMLPFYLDTQLLKYTFLLFQCFQVTGNKSSK